MFEVIAIWLVIRRTVDTYIASDPEHTEALTLLRAALMSYVDRLLVEALSEICSSA